MIKKFGIGYSLDDWNAFLKHAQSLHYTKDILQISGLVIEKNHKNYDRFRGRLIFPIHNISGKVIGFGGRTLQKVTEYQPKYINSPETILYQKRKIVYGIFQAKKFIIKHDCCYVVEGYTDVIALHKISIENVVSPLGTALTSEHLQIISRFTKNIIMIFDGDKAGIEAVLKSIDLVLAQGLTIQILSLIHI